MAPEDQSTWVEGRSMCRDLGATPSWRARTSLMTLATPDAIWVWPMLDFTEPSSSGRSGSRSGP
ncbi:hypothetical protein SAZ_40875 [Streptomyces noursei ZPM]|nr:hypothetical protein SAZ_40875 [Streptomyces noursei ZPM]